MEITALVCPDTGDFCVSPVILGTNCREVHSVFQKFLDRNWALTFESNKMQSDLKEFSEDPFIDHRHGVVYHLG